MRICCHPVSRTLNTRKLHFRSWATVLACVFVGRVVDIWNAHDARCGGGLEPDRVRYSVHGRRFQCPSLGELRLRGARLVELDARSCI